MLMKRNLSSKMKGGAKRLRPRKKLICVHYERAQMHFVGQKKVPVRNYIFLVSDLVVRYHILFVGIVTVRNDVLTVIDLFDIR